MWMFWSSNGCHLLQAPSFSKRTGIKKFLRPDGRRGHQCERYEWTETITPVDEVIEGYQNYSSHLRS